MLAQVHARLHRPDADTPAGEFESYGDVEQLFPKSGKRAKQRHFHRIEIGVHELVVRRA